MSESKTYEVTEEHFAVFSAEVRRLWDLWQLGSIRLELERDKLGGAEIGARCSFHPIQHSAFIKLNTEWDTEVTEARLRAYARHETIHALIGELGALACARYVTDDELDAAEHLVLNRLDKLLPR